VKPLRTFVASSTLILALQISAHADTILLGSYGTGAANPGVINTAVSYFPTTSTVNTGSTITYDIGPGAIWHTALPNSSYITVSYIAQLLLSIFAPMTLEKSPCYRLPHGF
jgi:hypothetical protein